MTSYHLKESDLVSQAECQFCQTLFTERDKQFTLQYEPRVEMVQCSVCGLGTGESIPKDEAVSKLYDPAHYQASLTNSSRISQKLARKIVNAFNLSGRDEISVLDFGGGNGVLCDQVRQQLTEQGVKHDRVSCTVVDVYDSVAFKDVNFMTVDDFDKSDENYTFVIASAVLEHLPEAKVYLQRLLSRVESGGIFYARTPYEAPLAKLPLGFKTSWPIHIHDMGPVFWEYVITDLASGYEVVQSNTSTLESNFNDKPFKTLVAFFLKLPSYIETSILKKVFGYSGVLWKFIGGGEVVLRKR